MRSLDRLRIVLVEDNETDATMVIEALKTQNIDCHVDWLKDGIELMQYLNHPISFEDEHLILLDINMPLKRGDECLKEMKEKKMDNFPVIVLTSSSDRAEFDNLYRWGANACVTKPDTFEEYQNLVRAIGNFWTSAATLPTGPSIWKH